MPKPTSSDIMREVQELKEVDRRFLKELQAHDRRLRQLENWKIAYDAASKALEGITPSRSVASIDRELVKIIIKILGIMTVLVGMAAYVVENVIR